MMAQKLGPKHVVNLNEIEIQTVLVVFWLTKTYNTDFCVYYTYSRTQPYFT